MCILISKILFFYFFEGRNNPDKADVISWTNGGLYIELTPISLYSDLVLERRRSSSLGALLESGNLFPRC